MTPQISCSKLVLDLDGVLANLAPELSYRMVRSFKTKNIPTVFNVRDCANVEHRVTLGWVREQFADPSLFLNAVPHAEAWFYCNHKFDQGSDIMLMTERPEETLHITERWMDEWNLAYNDIQTVKPEGNITQFLWTDDIFITDQETWARDAANICRSYIVDRYYNRERDIGYAERIQSVWDVDAKKEM